jgi:two-component system nitrogen regulation response regulator GlnG
MSEIDTTAEATLPSVALPAARDYRSERLVLTIIFHPDTTRIGEVADLGTAGSPRQQVLGRLQPCFRSTRSRDQERPLEDGHVSRSALGLAWRGQQLLVERGATETRCQVDGTELVASISLQVAQLHRGVAILLGHSVVLLLRLGDAPPAGLTGGDSGIIGSSAYAANLSRQITEAAGNDLDVLIRGETGTGKELVATAIHAASRRAGAALVAVNMAAIPEGLAPAVLFGAARGAYTGADSATAGYFQQAEGGTLFLDEVGDTAPEVQPQLLRALQEREIQVVGGPVRRVDVRVVSATDAELEGGSGEFRSALRHRLGALEISLQPLREHPEDIGELWWHFLRREFAASGRPELLPGEDSPPLEIARWADLFHRCLRYPWAGNVRELGNRARQVALSSRSRLEPPRDLYAVLEAHVEGPADAAAAGGPAPPGRRMGSIGAEEFYQVWEAQGYEVAAIARSLGVSRQSVYRRMEAAADIRTAGDVSARELTDCLAEAAGDLRQVAHSLRVSHSGLLGRARQLGVVSRGSND